MRRHVFLPAKAALRAAMRQSMPPPPEPRRLRVRPPPRAVRVSAVPPASRSRSGWSLGKAALPQAREVVRAAHEVFPHHPAAVDAVLGWLFARFPRFGARGSDMVVHHAMLRDERYYEGWVALCMQLRLFERDR